MLIGTLKAQERLTQEFGFDERRAKGIVELFSSAEEQVTTKSDLEAMEERLKKMVWRVAVSVLAANAAIMAALLALFGGLLQVMPLRCFAA